jgi:DNA-binding response OmpR family regulator
VSKRKLLLADDSITIQKVVNLTFADEGIEVISVGDGDSAMRKFDEFIPDLVMADVNMPGLNGYEVCRIIKRTEETQNIPVILLVGSFEPFDETAAKDAGADDYLTKPFQSIRQLVNKVTDLLNQRERVPETSDETPQTATQPVDTFAETLEFEKQADSPTESGYQREEIGSEFGDAGMDDEMIETSPANDYLSDADSGYQADTTTIDYAKTQPLNAEDLKGFDIVQGTTAEPEAPESFEYEEAVTEKTESAPERAEAASFDEEARKLSEPPAYEDTEAEEKRQVVSETEPEIDYYLPDGEEENREGFEREVSDAETLEPEVSYQDEQPRTADFSEAPVEESGETEIAEQASAPETDFVDEPQTAEETFEEAETETPAQPEGESTGKAEAETPETEIPQTEAPATETSEAETSQAEPAPETSLSAPADIPSFTNFDDGDLLELPPLVEETGIRPQAKIEPVAAAEPAPATAEPETEAAPTPTAAESEIAAQSFPPELIEAIAQKVAEKISAKTMNDVLPQITELVMKKMAEENLKNEK